MWPVSQPLCAIVPNVVWHVAAPVPHTTARGKGEATDVQVEDSAIANSAGDRIPGPSGIQSNVQGARGDFSWAVAKGGAASSYATRLKHARRLGTDQLRGGSTRRWRAIHYRMYGDPL